MRPLLAAALFCAHAAGLISLFAGCAPRAPAGSVRHLDDEYGFRSASFEEPISSFADLEFVRDRKGLACYQRADENLDVGSARLAYIHYCFFEDRLASVALWGTGTETANHLLQEMRRMYGRGQPLTSTQGRSKQSVGEIWNGGKATVVLLFLQRESFPAMDDSEVVVTISSNKLMEKRSPGEAQAPPGSSPAN
jgi:hypothetical protein